MSTGCRTSPSFSEPGGRQDLLTLEKLDSPCSSQGEELVGVLKKHFEPRLLVIADVTFSLPSAVSKCGRVNLRLRG